MYIFCPCLDWVSESSSLLKPFSLIGFIHLKAAAASLCSLGLVVPVAL